MKAPVAQSCAFRATHRIAQSALFSLFVAKNVFKTTLILPGVLFNGPE
jgi:hypothetical protein